VVVTDAEGHVLARNAPFARLFAISDASLRSAPVEDLIIVSRCRAAYRAARRRALTDRQSFASGPTSGFVAVHADGGEFAANLRFARTNEDPPHLATWIRDLTEDQTGLTPPSSREARYERAEELTGFGTWEWTSDRILWSDNLFRIYGLRPAEITPSAEYVFAHCHPDDKKASSKPKTSWIAPAGVGTFATGTYGPTGQCVT
jgi:PAS domain-containing protein